MFCAGARTIDALRVPGVLLPETGAAL
jgi:hypothetical protein